MERKTERLQGLDIDTFGLDDALAYGFEHFGHVVTLNPEMVMEAQKNSKFQNIVKNAELVIPDGVGIELGFKILGRKVSRIAGIEYSKRMIEQFANSGRGVAFVGAKPGVVDVAIANLKKEFPNLSVVYSRNGYFDDKELVLSELKQSGAELVLVALGSPYQEEFISCLKVDMPKTLFIGVGGSFDVWAGQVERAPEIFQKLGLEWLYRTLKQPERFKRIFPTLPLFVLRVVKERFTRC